MDDDPRMQQVMEYLRKETPGLTENERIDDCIRIGAFLVAMRAKGTPVPFNGEDLLEHIGALGG